MTAAAIRPRRSCLFLPGDRERVHEKAEALAADALIFDLEDAVAPDAKPGARRTVAAAIAGRDYGGRELVVRINGLDTPWGREDIAMAAASGAHALLAPKVMTAADVAALGEAMAAVGAPEGMALWIMIETPRAVLELGAIAVLAGSTRLAALVMGTNDLAKDMRARATPDRVAFQAALGATVLAARAHGLAAIDGVYNDFADSAGLEAEAVQGRTLGFDGKSLIHPAQIDICNRIFAPEPEAVARAEAVVAAFARPENAARGVIQIDGRMVERLHLEEAEALLAMARAIGELEA